MGPFNRDLTDLKTHFTTTSVETEFELAAYNLKLSYSNEGIFTSTLTDTKSGGPDAKR